MIQPKKEKFKYLLAESLLAYVTNSVGTKMFRNFYVKKGAKKIDVLNDGKVSCAIFASTVLYLFGQNDKPHFTVARTADDLIRHGAKKVSTSKLKPGDVIFWDDITTSTGQHNHVGFYIGNKQAVSNSETTGIISQHSYDFSGKRKIELALRLVWKS